MFLAVCTGACGPLVVWHGHSPDRRHRILLLERGDTQFVRLGEREGPRFDGIATPTITFSPDNHRLAYAARQEDVWFVVLDDSVGAYFDGIGPVVFSPDSRHLAYAAAH